MKKLLTILLILIPVLFSLSCAAPGSIVNLQKRVEENPEDPQARYDLALAYLEMGTEWEGTRDVGIPIITGEGWTAKAEREFQKAAELDPDSSTPHYWLKVIYNARGKYEEADKESRLYSELKAREKKGPEK